jgi:hypothetical protein
MLFGSGDASEKELENQNQNQLLPVEQEKSTSASDSSHCSHNNNGRPYVDSEHWVRSHYTICYYKKSCVTKK